MLRLFVDVYLMSTLQQTIKKKYIDVCSILMITSEQ